MSSVVIGRVTAPHGVRGAVRFLPLTDFPERFETQKNLVLRSPEGELFPLSIKSVQHTSGGMLLITFDEIGDRNQAETLRGYEAVIDESERWPLSDGQYWVSDLIGMECFSEDGLRLGKVTDLLNQGASDLFEILDDHGQTHFIPFVDEFVLSVDMVQRRVTFHLIEGLWE